jgi:hypothetical protein
MRRLVALGICATLALGGCGGSDSDSSSDTAATASGETQASTIQPSHQSASGQKQGEEGKGQEKESSAANSTEKTSSSKQSPATVKVPPISSAPTEGSEAPAPGVETVKGGDNSVQTYGTEASEDARTEAAIALQAFLNARLKEDWEGVCAAFARPARAQIDKFIEQLESKGKELGCAGAMAVLDKGAAQSQLRQEAQITEVLSFRGDGHVPGDPSYLIFIGRPESTLYSMPMYLEGGTWKVGLALPSELPV